MKLIVSAILVLCCFYTNAVQAASPPVGAAATVKALVAKYAQQDLAKLTMEDHTALLDIDGQLATAKTRPGKALATAVDKLVSTLSVDMLGTPDLLGLTAAAGRLYAVAPANPRVLNLLAATLSRRGCYTDAITVYTYLCTLVPGNVLAMNNLAAVYMDNNQPELAKPLLDKVLGIEPDNPAALETLTDYWYVKGNNAKVVDLLFKRAKGGGYVVRETEKPTKTITDEAGTPLDTPEELEKKMDAVKDLLPASTANLIEPYNAGDAAQIRAHYGKLTGEEFFKLPMLPQVKVNSLRDYYESNPYISAWTNAVNAKLDRFHTRNRLATVTAPPPPRPDIDDDDADTPTPTPDPAEARAKLPMMDPEAADDLSHAQIQQMVEQEQAYLDGISALSRNNYIRYRIVLGNYTAYFMQVTRKYEEVHREVESIYEQKVKDENEVNQAKVQVIGKMDTSTEAAQAAQQRAQKQEMRRHAKALDTIGESCYRQWINVAFPNYAQRLQPRLNEMWRVCLLYIKNIDDPQLQTREYRRLVYHVTGMGDQAISTIQDGTRFQYYGVTDDEDQEISDAIDAAQKEADAKKKEFKKSTATPPDELIYQWFKKRLSFELSLKYLGLKVSAQSVEFTASVPGVFAGIKYDFSKSVLESYTGVGDKSKIGIDICGVGAAVEVKGEVFKKTATWDFANNTYQESYTAKVEVKGSLGPVNSSVEAVADISLNPSVKVDTKGGYKWAPM